MYNLTMSLKYDEPLKLDAEYRYDFVTMDYAAESRNGPLNGNVFVFRTIKEGAGAGNVLIDLIHYSNVNGFDAALHGDSHFHLLSSKQAANVKKLVLTDKVEIEAVVQDEGVEYFAVLKDQKYKWMNEIKSNAPYIDFSEFRMFLFSILTEHKADRDEAQFGPVFNLQREQILHNNRYWNYIDLTKLDVEWFVGRRLDPSTPWIEVKESIERARDSWAEKKRMKFSQLLEMTKSQEFLPL